MTCPPSPKTKFWVVEVGDDPGDETCQGPYTSFLDAVEAGSKHYIGRFYWVYPGAGPTMGKNFIGFDSQISSLYIIWGFDDKPTFDKDIRPFLKGD